MNEEKVETTNTETPESVNTLKMTDEELQELKNLENAYVNNIYALGKVQLEKKEVEAELEDIKKTEVQLYEQYKEIQARERAYHTVLGKKYGNGNIDLATGTFIKAD